MLSSISGLLLATLSSPFLSSLQEQSVLSESKPLPPTKQGNAPPATMLSLGAQKVRDLFRFVIARLIFSIAAYISNRRLLLSLADAGGRLMYAYKDLLELAGLTTRIYTLVSTLHQLPPLQTPEIDVVEDPEAIQLKNVDVRVPGASKKMVSKRWIWFLGSTSPSDLASTLW